MARRLTILCPAILGLIWGATTNARAQQLAWQPGPAKAPVGTDLAQIVVRRTCHVSAALFQSESMTSSWRR